MNRCKQTLMKFWSSIPHAGGDEPGYKQHYDCATAVFPTQVGMKRGQRIHFCILLSVFPTQVVLNRNDNTSSALTVSILHVGGDEPGISIFKGITGKYSLRK